MGLLDDAIREHLELKRQHGADPSEVARQEREALGPVRSAPRSRLCAGAGRATADVGAGRRAAARRAPEPAADEPDVAADPTSAEAEPATPEPPPPDRPIRRPTRSRSTPRTNPPRRRAGAGARARRPRRRGRARGDAGVPPGDAGARPALVRAEAAARLRLRPLSRALHRGSTSSRPTPLAGNALAVIHDADGLDDATMLAMARETRLSRDDVRAVGRRGPAPTTATASGPSRGELPFAGHPSLGTAVAVARAARGERSARYVQETGAGLQPVEVELAEDGRAQRVDAAGAGRVRGRGRCGRGHGSGRPDARRRAPDCRRRWSRPGSPHLIAPVAATRRRSAAPRPTTPRCGRLLDDLTGASSLYLAVVRRRAGRARARGFFARGRRRGGPGHRLGRRPAVCLRGAADRHAAARDRPGREMGRRCRAS